MQGFFYSAGVLGSGPEEVRVGINVVNAWYIVCEDPRSFAFFCGGHVLPDVRTRAVDVGKAVHSREFTRTH